MDSDSLAGALGLKHKKPTLSEQVLLNNATGHLQDSTVCFEKMMQLGNLSENNVIDMIQCYIGLDQPETALLVSESLMKQMHERNVQASLLTESVEPLWRLGRFEELDKLLENTKLRESSNWGIRCGQVLLGIRKGHVEEVSTEIRKCRLSVLEKLRATGDDQSSYNKVYPHVMKLNLITEMEIVQDVVQKFALAKTVQESHDILKNLFHQWDNRLQILQPTAR